MVIVSIDQLKDLGALASSTLAVQSEADMRLTVWSSVELGARLRCRLTALQH